MKAGTIRITCRGADTLDPLTFVDFQGNLKSLAEADFKRLKKQIIKLGFSEPISVWLNDGQNYILNGHQRIRVITRMIQDGWKCPPLPVNYIEAETRDEAKEKLLSLTSQYGQIEDQGLYEFLHDTNIKAEELVSSFRFPEVNLDHFVRAFYQEQLGLPKDSDAEPEVPFAEAELKPNDTYMLVIFPDTDVFAKHCERFGLRRVKFNIGSSGAECYIRYGMGRVLPFETLKAHLIETVDGSETNDAAV